MSIFGDKRLYEEVICFLVINTCVSFYLQHMDKFP